MGIFIFYKDLKRSYNGEKILGIKEARQKKTTI